MLNTADRFAKDTNAFIQLASESRVKILLLCVCLVFVYWQTLQALLQADN